MDSQAELFPFASPETVLAYCRRFEAKVLKVGPELTANNCLRLLGELSLATAMLEKISLSIEHSSAWKHRESLAAVPPARHDRSIDLPRIAPRWARARRGGVFSSS